MDKRVHDTGVSIVKGKTKNLLGSTDKIWEIAYKATSEKDDFSKKYENTLLVLADDMREALTKGEQYLFNATSDNLEIIAVTTRGVVDVF